MSTLLSLNHVCDFKYLFDVYIVVKHLMLIYFVNRIQSYVSVIIVKTCRPDSTNNMANKIGKLSRLFIITRQTQSRCKIVNLLQEVDIFQHAFLVCDVILLVCRSFLFLLRFVVKIDVLRD